MFQFAIFRLQLPAAGRQTNEGRIFFFLKTLLSSLTCGQIWLSLRVYERASTNTYLTKLKINKSLARTSDLFISNFVMYLKWRSSIRKNAARFGDKII
jgi:hypothetical protein